MASKKVDKAGAWEQELNSRIVTFVVSNGSLVDPRASQYGWMGDDTGEREHVMECGLRVPACSWADGEWTEFYGTFAEPASGTHRGVDAVVTCACGLVEGETFRYTGSHGDMLRAITS